MIATKGLTRAIRFAIKAPTVRNRPQTAPITPQLGSSLFIYFFLLQLRKEKATSYSFVVSIPFGGVKEPVYIGISENLTEICYPSYTCSLPMNTSFWHNCSTRCAGYRSVSDER